MKPNASRAVWSLLAPFLLFSTTVEAGKTLTLDITEERPKLSPALDLEKRQVSGNGFRNTDISYNSSSYDFFVNVNIGDGNANFKLAVIQNPYTWVARAWNDTLDCHPLDNCDAGSTSGFFDYDPPTSESYRNLTNDDGFDISYVDNRYALGEWARDSFRLGQLTVEDVNFGIVNSYNATPALGLDLSSSRTPYSTFIEVMLENKIINTLTYGIYIGDWRKDDNTGKSLTFGGVDLAKFDLPMVTYNSLTTYSVDVLEINIVSGGSVTSSPMTASEGPVVGELNFGTPSLHLSTPMFDAIMAELGVAPSDNGAVLGIPSDDTGLEFVLEKGLKIFIPFSQLVTPSTVEGWYWVLIFESTTDTIALGNPFFRSAYVFYDFTNREISIAAARFNETSQNIIEVGVNNGSITDLKPPLNQITTTITTSTSTLPSTNPSTSTSTSTPTTTPEPPAQKSLAGPIGGGVGGGVALIALIVCGVFYMRKRRPRPQALPMPIAPDASKTPPMDDNFTPRKPTFTSGASSPISEHQALSPISPFGFDGDRRFSQAPTVTSSTGNANEVRVHSRISELA